MTDSISSGDEKRRRARSWWPLAAVRLLLIVAWTLFCMFCYGVFRIIVHHRPTRYRMAVRGTRLWGLICCRLMGYKITVRGCPPVGGTLIAPNHLGYADIIVVSACCRCLFVAKAEVEGWALFGQGAKLFEHIFVERRRGRAMMDTRDAVVERLIEGCNVCIFLEGTSSGGIGILPFRPSFIQPAIDAGVPVIPVAVKWSSRNPDVVVEEDIAYWKDHVFFSHLWRHLGLCGTQVDVNFCAPLASEGMHRKELADKVRDCVAAAWTGMARK